MPRPTPPAPSVTELLADPRYARLRARDRAADGQFVYAVTSTGVFCRPSCAARPARPENIRLYDTPAAARAAGFRPCRRCRPEAEGPDAETLRLQAVAAHITAHADETLTLAELGERFGISPFHLQRRFTEVIGVSPKAFQAHARLQTFKAALRAGEDVLGATFGAGYGSTSRVYAAVEAALGMTPSAYRRGGAGEEIIYALRQTSLGLLLMAATARGVCLVAFGESEGGLVAELAAEFPQARLAPAPPASRAPLDDWMAVLEAELGGDARPAAAAGDLLPLDIRGTAFQLRVWRLLLSVPSGQVVSYGEIAEAIGNPKAVRATGAACGANRLAVLIPCHRAVRGDGALAGYRWGIPRKRALLAAERARASAVAG